MDDFAEKRTERRLRYHWPVWFAEDFDEELTQGQMVDVSSEGAAFTCYNNHGGLYTGQNITARFSVPQFENDESFGMSSFTRYGQVCRIENINDFTRKIAVQFAEPLPFKPGEQVADEADSRERLKAVTI